MAVAPMVASRMADRTPIQLLSAPSRPVPWLLPGPVLQLQVFGLAPPRGIALSVPLFSVAGVGEGKGIPLSICVSMPLTVI